MEDQNQTALTDTVRLRNIATNPEDKLAVQPFAQDDTNTHGHDCFELAYVTGGSAGQTLNGVTEMVQKGDYFILDYGSRHRYQNCRSFTLINCLFLPEVIDETLSGCKTFEEVLRVWLIRYHKQYFGKTPVNRIFHDEDGRILSLLLGMQEEYEKKSTGYQEIFRCRLMEIVILTMRKYVQNNTSADREIESKSSVILDAVRFLETHYTDKAVLGNFCKQYHYSLQYISRRFKQETGLTALDYLQKIRMEKCCELLAGSDLRIQEIAMQIGYEDMKFFHTIFQRFLHMSPREYRRMIRSSAKPQISKQI